ncbi:hypothetical protein AAF712_016387, partial [Marasmius tenuissimus]
MTRGQDYGYASLLHAGERDSETLGEYKYPPDELKVLANGRAARGSRLKTFVIVVQGVVNIVLALLLFRVWTREKSTIATVSEEQLLYFNHLIERQVVIYPNALNGDTTPYMGPPSPEVDKAWDDLYQ